MMVDGKTVRSSDKRVLMSKLSHQTHTYLASSFTYVEHLQPLISSLIPLVHICLSTSQKLVLQIPQLAQLSKTTLIGKLCQMKWQLQSSVITRLQHNCVGPEAKKKKNRNSLMSHRVWFEYLSYHDFQLSLEGMQTLPTEPPHINLCICQ